MAANDLLLVHDFWCKILFVKNVLCLGLRKPRRHRYVPVTHRDEYSAEVRAGQLAFKLLPL